MGFSLKKLGDIIFPGKKLIGDITGANQAAKAAESAAQAQVQASQEANQLLRDIYGQQRADLAPWNIAGLTALNPLMAMTGMPQVSTDQVRSYLGDAAGKLPEGFEIPQFTGNPLERLMTDPGYQFRLGQGQQALERSAAARGGLLSGRQMKDLTQYGQDMGSQEFQNAFNRLAGIAGIGQSATQQGNVAAGQFGGQAAENILGMGNARASGYIGRGNRATNRFNSIMQLAGGAGGALSGLGAAGFL